MQNSISQSIDLDKLRKDYWSKMQIWEDFKKQKEEDSKKHNGYIDRPFYHQLSRRTEEARMECSSIYLFIQKYFLVDKIEVKRGQYKFTHDGFIYTLVKMETEDNFGWRKGMATHWELHANHQSAPYIGEYADTKSELIDWVNHKIKRDFIDSILGPKPQNS